MKNLIILILFVLIPFLSNASFSTRDYKCVEILEWEDGDGGFFSSSAFKLRKEKIKSWLEGYIHARNYENNSFKGKGVSIDSIYNALIKYCRTNPLDYSHEGATYIYDRKL